MNPAGSPFQTPTETATMKILLGAALLTLGLLAVPAHAANADCVAQADAKKLAGAARTSFLKKCEREAAPKDAAAACERSADEKKLAGAARASHIKKCLADHGKP